MLFSSSSNRDKISIHLFVSENRLFPRLSDSIDLIDSVEVQKYIVDSCIICMLDKILSTVVPIFLTTSFLSFVDSNMNLLIMSPSSIRLHGFVVLGLDCLIRRQAVGLRPAR